MVNPLRQSTLTVSFFATRQAYRPIARSHFIYPLHITDDSAGLAVGWAPMRHRPFVPPFPLHMGTHTQCLSSINLRPPIRGRFGYPVSPYSSTAQSALSLCQIMPSDIQSALSLCQIMPSDIHVFLYSALGPVIMPPLSSSAASRTLVSSGLWSGI
jgi:hypothetical protein